MPQRIESHEGLSRVWCLHRIKLLMGMSQRTIDRVWAMIRTTRRRRGEWIYMLGDPSHSIYFLQEGRMKISALTEDGHEVLLGIVGPGEIFGDVGAIQGTLRTTSAQALDDLLLCELHHKDFESLVTANPEISLQLLKSMSSRLSRAEAQVLNLICKDVSTRVREALMELIDSDSSSEATAIRIRITQQDLANLIGASRQKTWQTLKELQDSGVLVLGYRSILVTAPQKLRIAQVVRGRLNAPVNG
jgi:CRP/FNR family transcriptional regulator, cyclic AMP receptor protein